MVVKKAWIPGTGTYSVGTSENPIDPTIGNLSHNEHAPREESKESNEKDSNDNSEKTASAEDLLRDNHDLENFLNIASLANLAHVHKTDNEWKARGDPTDIAIQVFASRFNWNRSRWTGENAIWTQRAEYPFDSSIKKMSVIFESADHSMILTKGAVERVLESCSLICTRNDATELTDEIRGHILENMEALASQGLRVLALASRELSAPYRRAQSPRATGRRDGSYVPRPGRAV